MEGRSHSKYCRHDSKGVTLREVITAAMTPEMHRAIYQRYRPLPTDDKELIAAVRDVGIIEEEIALSRAQIQKIKKMGFEDSDDEEEGKKGKKNKKHKKGNKDSNRSRRYSVGIMKDEKRRKNEGRTTSLYVRV